MRAHPRSRGENVGYGEQTETFTGSSPLTRGKSEPHPALARLFGLIPAHAGKMREGQGGARQLRAHPRSRGENLGVSMGALTVMGSSPLTRGKYCRQAQHPRRAGLIPAHAGKIIATGTGRSEPRAHPRSRGENFACPVGHSLPVGSSPLTRGKCNATPRGRSGRGLIPAHAGKML